MNDERREPESPVEAQEAAQCSAEEAASAEGVEGVEAGTGQGPGPRGAPVPGELDAEELRDRWQRAVAETDNLRKRYERQLEDARRAERDRVTAAWLPVVDHLELALQHAEADPRAIVAGVEAVCQQASAVLAQLGYRRIAGIGEPFDPARQEAAQVRDEPGAQPGSVLQVLRAGYGSEAGLLRPAVVTVAAKQEE